jgi:hypothetical protein
MKIIVSAAVALSVLATLATSADATFWGGNGKNTPKGTRTIFTDKNLP